MASPRIPILRRLLPAAAIGLLALGGAARAGQQDFALNNTSGYEIATVEVSPSTSRNWGRDILGDNTLPSGRSLNITFNNATKACKFDVRVTWTDGDQGVLENVNLARFPP